MASVTITNLTSNVVQLHELYCVVRPNYPLIIEREIDQLYSMPALQQLWYDGVIDITITRDAAEDDFISQKLGGGSGGGLVDGDYGDVTVSDGATQISIKPGAIGSTELADESVSYSKLQDISATQRVLARDSSGAGPAEEVSIGQVLDWVSTTTGAIPTRTGADTWAAAANAKIDTDGDITLAENSTPTTPAASTVKLFATNIANCPLPAYMNADGTVNPIQAMLGVKNIAMWVPAPNGNTMQTLGIVATVQGTGTARAFAATNLFTATKRIGYVSAAGAGNTCGVRGANAAWLWRGNISGSGGFYCIIHFGWSDAVLVATARGFAGVYGSTGLPTDVNPSTLTNIIGVGNDNGDANLQLYASDGTARTRIDLGSNFPANTVNTDWYELHLYCASNDDQVDFRLVRLNTGHVSTGTIDNPINLPSNTTALIPTIWRGNGGTASAVAVDVGVGYFESK